MDESAPRAGDPSTTLLFSLYVRTPVAGRRTVTIDRLSALAATDAIDDFEIETVERRRILADGDDLGAGRHQDDLASLAAWETGTVESTVEVRAESSRLGRTVRAIEPPDRVLAVRHDDTPACVFPCTDGTTTWSVSEFLDSFERRGETPEGLDVSLARK